MNLWGYTVCKVTGKHKRGRVIISHIEDVAGAVVLTYKGGIPVKAGHALYECPRCGFQWTRKVGGKQK